ncbi:MAG TPA: hypothetical protein VFG50_13985 [Rhodothermales bacterium]|nr:hypothetical protein [Rhodothermales bacterium]
MTRGTLRTAVFGLLFATASVGSAEAQALVDTLFTWRGYHHSAHCRVQIYAAPRQDERVYAVILKELADNDGPSTLADVEHLAEMIGRAFSIDPAHAYWILHWGAFSFAGADPGQKKEIFLRATFRWTKSRSLASPTWRVVTREEIEELTGRRFR